MYLTQNAQILSEHKPWNEENNRQHEKNLMKKWPGVDEKISDQVDKIKSYKSFKSAQCEMFCCHTLFSS